jgi:hypothetical protein
LRKIEHPFENRIRQQYQYEGEPQGHESVWFGLATSRSMVNSLKGGPILHRRVGK